MVVINPCAEEDASNSMVSCIAGVNLNIAAARYVIYPEYEPAFL